MFTQSIFAYAFGGILFIIAFILLIKPIKLLFKLIINSALGCVGLMLFNLLGGLIGMHIGVNFATALTVGVLGLPGLAVLLVLQQIFKI